MQAIQMAPKLTNHFRVLTVLIQSYTGYKPWIQALATAIQLLVFNI